MRKQLNRYTQRELSAIIRALETVSVQHFDAPFIVGALIKSKLRLRREKQRAK